LTIVRLPLPEFSRPRGGFCFWLACGSQHLALPAAGYPRAGVPGARGLAAALLAASPLPLAGVVVRGESWCGE
ncbi:MAG: hypothetical protein IJN29_12455, partial [Akkermansia sp.]|nr:hypothetical protein [Akkermansia sp.]